MKIVYKVVVRLLAAILAMGAILAGSEVYLASQGYSLEWRNEAKKGQEGLSPQLAEYWEKCGWGPDRGERVSSEDPSVIERVWNNGMRECRPAIDKKAPVRVAFFGCSYTYGEGVKAQDTFVYRLNQQYPNVCFDNYGIRGAGLIHCLYRMEQVLNSGQKYDLIVYDAIPGHYIRSTVIWADGNLEKNRVYCVAPSIKKDPSGNWKIVYCDEYAWPFDDRLLTVDYLKRVYYGYQLSRADQLFKQRYGAAVEWEELDDGWRYLVNRMAKVSNEHGADFIVATVTGECSCGDKILPGIELINIDMPGSGEACNRVLGNRQFHPNGKVHAHWAKEFGKWFDKYAAKKFPEALVGAAKRDEKPADK